WRTHIPILSGSGRYHLDFRIFAVNVSANGSDSLYCGTRVVFGILSKLVKTVTCRHCGEPFIPSPKKPGYLDECAPCLHERTRPPRTVTTDLEKVTLRLRAELEKKGIFSDQLIEDVVIAVRESYWKRPAQK